MTFARTPILEKYTATTARIVTLVTKITDSGEDLSVRSTTGTEYRDDIRHFRWGDCAPEQPIQDVGVVLFEEFGKRLLVGSGCGRVMIAKVALQHQVEFTQAAAGPPTQLPD